MLALFALARPAIAADVQPPPPPPPPPPASPASPNAQIEAQMQKAQERLQMAAEEVANLSMRLNEQFMQAEPWGTREMSKAILGINLGGSASGPDGPDGVRIVSVSPGGPADEAGLQARDVIVSFKGQELHADKGRTPQRQFLDLIRDVKPDQPVDIAYRRDDVLQTTRIKPISMSTYVTRSVDRGLQSLGQRFDDRRFKMERRDPSPFGSAELLNLSPGLGHYFGTDKGLLVVRAPRDARLQLRDGDVLLDIDGRVPSSAGHASEILGSYQSGEKLKLHILRDHNRMELSVEIPPDGGRMETSRLGHLPSSPSM
jgi:hypothetical protein